MEEKLLTALFDMKEEFGGLKTEVNSATKIMTEFKSEHKKEHEKIIVEMKKNSRLRIGVEYVVSVAVTGALATLAWLRFHKNG